MTEKSGTLFDPNSTLTAAEAVVIASHIHNTYYGDNAGSKPLSHGITPMLTT